MTDFEKSAWLALADELSADPRFLSGADPIYVEAGQVYASRRGLPWPPPGDLDIAIQMDQETREAEVQTLLRCDGFHSENAWGECVKCGRKLEGHDVC